jgi:hypothetical protein
LLSAGIPLINLGHVGEPIPASSDLQLGTNFQNVPWDYIEIGDFRREILGMDGKAAWSGDGVAQLS